MTPKVLKFEQHEDRILELSEGEGISRNGEKIYGVTELIKANTRFGLESTGRGRMFYNKKEALKHYSILKTI